MQTAEQRLACWRELLEDTREEHEVLVPYVLAEEAVALVAGRAEEGGERARDCALGRAHRRGVGALRCLPGGLR